MVKMRKKVWKRKDAQSAAYIIRYYKPDLIVKSVSITNKPKGMAKRKGYGKVSNTLGEFGLFIHFKRKNMNKYQKLPYFCNGWSHPLTLISSIERFFAALLIFDNTTKAINKFIPKNKLDYPQNLNKFAGEAAKFTYWDTHKFSEGRV